MAKFLIPAGSRTGDPPGRLRYLEFEEEDLSTAAHEVTIPEHILELEGYP